MLATDQKPSLRCTFRIHAWVRRVNDSGERYVACKHCDAYNDNLTDSREVGALGFGDF